MSGMLRRIGVGVGSGLAAGVLVACAGTALAQGDAKAPAKIQTLFVAEKADLSQFLTDPRDARLKEALGMIPARIRELPGEVGADREPVEAMSMLMSALARPGRMAITVNAGNPADGMFGYGVVVSSLMADQKSADEFHTKIKAMLAGANLPPAPAGPKRFESMDDVTAGPLGRLSYGPRKAADGWRYEIVMGTLDNPDPAWSNLRGPMIKDMKPLVNGVIDLGGLTPAATMLATFAGPQNPQVTEMVREAGQSGLYGPDAMKIAFEMGNTETESRGRMVVEGAAKYREKLGMSSGTLDAADLAAVPGDAVLASVSKGDLSMFDRMIDEASKQGPDVDQALSEFKKRTGVDLRADILKTLGGTFAYYMSDSTGGGNAGSLVGLVSFKDRARFMEAHTKLVKFANEMLAQAPDVGKYARLASWTEAGVELVSLRLSGLPMPLEITYAATEKWLIAGVTPQATLAAAQQVAGKGDKGLMSIEGVARVAKGQKLASVSFMDTARMMRPGYPILSMIGSAISSGVRSPVFASGAKRDPGMIVPTYRELARDVKPTVMVSYWEGENFVVDSHGDRSVLVGLAGGLGTMVHVLPAIAVPAAAIGAAADKHNHQGGDAEQGDDEDDKTALRMIPLWTTPEMFGLALQNHPAVTVAALRAAGVEEWATGVVRSAR